MDGAGRKRFRTEGSDGELPPKGVVLEMTRTQFMDQMNAVHGSMSGSSWIEERQVID